jgi:replicative DNA helicase
MSETKGRELVFRNDPVGEQCVIAATLVSPEVRRALAERHAPDVFLVPEHRAIWQALREAVRRGLGADPATLSRLSGGEVDASYLAELMRARPDPPDEKTLAYWVEQLLWDRQRHTALTGPISGLLEAIETGEEPSRVRGLARAVAASFDGFGERKHLLDPDELIREQVADVRKRMAGRAIYPFGIPGLDFYDPCDRESWRMVPGTAPGLLTVVTGVPGAGKSTFTAHVVLGVARQRRRVLYGAWEMKGGVTLELLASLSLCETDPEWRCTRTDLQRGRLTEADLAKLEGRMRVLSRYVRFLANPFNRQAGVKRRTNAHNLDLVQGYVADSGCEVFVADLWKRCLVETRPDEEEEALIRQQAMLEELDVHGILVQQQRLKDVEMRPDKRPTREGIKGSGAWTEVADNIVGVHRPALWKPVTDDVLEADVLKQRYGEWPLAIEFDWDPKRGSVRGGRPVEYDVTASGGKAGNAVDAAVAEPKKKGWSGKR